jgi:nicotinate-nucleotide--dimethylbenzimidazole phosphoribosyltransferase
MVAIFAANHGVTDQGVSAFPREVTAQMVANLPPAAPRSVRFAALQRTQSAGV